MAYNEIKKRNSKTYYYRTTSFRECNKIRKRRLYLGVDLSPRELNDRGQEADKKIKEDMIKNNLILFKDKIIKILKKYKIKKAGIFGSYARGEQKKKSDIDIIIEPPKGIGLGFVGIALELEDKLKRKVDLLTYNGISPYFRKSILEDEVKII